MQLVNAYIPAFAILAGILMAFLTVIPSLVIESIAVRFGTFRETATTRSLGKVGHHPTFSWALYYCFFVNVASTLPGLMAVIVFAVYEGVLAWVLHYVITVLIELPLYRMFGIRLTGAFVAAVLAANVLTYAAMYMVLLLSR